MWAIVLPAFSLCSFARKPLIRIWLLKKYLVYFCVFSRYFECLLYPNGMWRHFNRSTIYIAPYPRALPGGAGWVANTTHYDCCYYDRMQERNPFGQPARKKYLVRVLRTIPLNHKPITQFSFGLKFVFNPFKSKQYQYISISKYQYI